MSPEAAKVLIDGVLAGLLVLPRFLGQVEALIDLKKRLGEGDNVTPEELQALFDDINARSARIQNA